MGGLLGYTSLFNTGKKWTLFSGLHYGSLLIPVLTDLIQWLLELPTVYETSTLPDKSVRINDALLTDSAAIGLNGTDQYAWYDTGSTLNNYFGACTISMWVYLDNTTGTKVIWSHGDSAHRVYAAGTELRINTTPTGATPFLATTWQHIAVDFDASGQGVAARLNGSTIWTGTVPAGVTNGNSKFTIGCRILGTPAVFMAGRVCGFVNTSTNGSSPPIAETTGLTCYDPSGNGNDMTLAVGSGSEKVMRSFRQPYFHYNLESGFSKDPLTDIEWVAENDQVIYLASIEADGSIDERYKHPSLSGMIYSGGHYSFPVSDYNVMTDLGATDLRTVFFSDASTPITYSEAEISAKEWHENALVSRTINGSLVEIVGTRNNPRDYKAGADGIGQYGHCGVVSPYNCTIERDLYIHSDTQINSMLWSIGTAYARVYLADASGNFVFGATTDSGVAFTPYLDARHTYAVDTDGNGDITSFRIDGAEVWSGLAHSNGLQDSVLTLSTRDLSGVKSLFCKSDDYGTTINGVPYDINEGSGSRSYASDGTMLTWMDYNGGSPIEAAPTWTVIEGQVAALAGVQVAAVGDGVDDYVDTGIVPITDGATIEILDVPQAGSVVATTAVHGPDVNFRIGSASGSTWMRWGGASYVGVPSQESGAAVLLKAVTKGDDLDVYADDVLLGTVSDMEPTITDTFKLFARTGPSDLRNSGVIYNEIQQGSTHQRLISTLDGRMYDTASQTYFTNQGTGDLGILQIPTTSYTSVTDVNGFPLLQEWINVRDTFRMLNARAGESNLSLTTGVLYPALSDGTDDVVGLGITNPAGNWHNGAETGFIKKVGCPDEAEFLVRPQYSSDGISFLNYYHQDMREHINFVNNILYERRTLSNGVLLVKQELVYTEAKEWTPDEYLRDLRALRDEGEHLIPLQEVTGGIGPDGTWFTIDGIHVVLVLDA